jgi:hypothetical protein
MVKNIIQIKALWRQNFHVWHIAGTEAEISVIIIDNQYSLAPKPIHDTFKYLCLDIGKLEFIKNHQLIFFAFFRERGAKR